jgi:hypothetical protein
MSILEQAELVNSLADRCSMLDKSDAGEAHLTLYPDDVKALRDLARRLYLMAPLEHGIKRLVMAKR